MQQIGFGGGWISPALKVHLQKQAPAQRSEPKATSFGGGWISPAVKNHLQKRQVSSGGGWISPAIRAHLARQF
jgi:CRISPR/Cas system CSM-associated protein Csm5 (group 7 of RAMP superfamily)